MPLNSHRRYQKAHHIEVNHERGCLFEHILVPTLPEFQNKLRELRQRAPARCKGRYTKKRNSLKFSEFLGESRGTVTRTQDPLVPNQMR